MKVELHVLAGGELCLAGLAERAVLAALNRGLRFGKALIGMPIGHGFRHCVGSAFVAHSSFLSVFANWRYSVDGSKRNRRWGLISGGFSGAHNF
jgi:hypothetical protein